VPYTSFLLLVIIQATQWSKHKKGDDPARSSPFLLFLVIVLPLIVFVGSLIGPLPATIGYALYLFIGFNIMISPVCDRTSLNGWVIFWCARVFHNSKNLM